jgi:hypothetical protein
LHHRAAVSLVPVDGGSLVSYFLPMIVFGLKVLLAIATGLVMTALL